MGRRPVALIAAALLALTAGTCSSDDDPDDPASTTTTTQSPEAEVEAAYLAFADMGARLLEAPDPADPEIGERTTGEAMQELVASMQALQEAGLMYDLGPEYMHQVESVVIDGSGAVLDVCVVDDSTQVNVMSGEVTAEGATTVSWTVKMRRVDARWIVEQITEKDVQEGIGECVQPG